MTFHRLLLLVVSFVLMPLARADVPRLLNHQGRVAVNGIHFEGTGQFKFALVNEGGTTTYWSNDGTSTAGSPPTSAVSLQVTKGLYAVLLGDTNLPHMIALDESALTSGDVRLRVWFNDGTNGFQMISPDQRLASTPYALLAAKVDEILLSEVLAAPARPIVAWGLNTNGQTTLPAIADVAAVAAGETFSLALLKTGTVTQWGSISAVLSGLTDVTQIAAGAAHALARRSDGTVVAWGDNLYDQATVPAGLTTATAIAAGEKHSMALRADGTVLVWGDNTFGQTDVPSGLNNVVAIASGYDHCLALRVDGTVVAWGRPDAGQTLVPPGLSNVVAIGAGAYHSLAVRSDGTVVAWGFDLGGQSTVPSGLTGVVQVAGGYDFTLALKSDGTVVAWGDDSDGRIAIPQDTAHIQSIACGASHSLALRRDLTPAPLARLDQSNTFQGRIGINRAPAVNSLEVEGQASKTTAGNWLANSDRRIKTNVEPVKDALQKLDQVRLVEFEYTDDYRARHPGIENKRYLNVIAQEFSQVFPEDVKSSGEKLPDGSSVLQVDTYPLTIYSAAAVQELHRENQALKQQLSAMEERLRKLETHTER